MLSFCSTHLPQIRKWLWNFNYLLKEVFCPTVDKSPSISGPYICKHFPVISFIIVSKLQQHKCDIEFTNCFIKIKLIFFLILIIKRADDRVSIQCIWNLFVPQRFIWSGSLALKRNCILNNMMKGYNAKIIKQIFFGWELYSVCGPRYLAVTRSNVHSVEYRAIRITINFKIKLLKIKVVGKRFLSLKYILSNWLDSR